MIKRRLYASAGVGHYWIVDPVARSLEALELKDGTWWESGVYGDDDLARIPPFDLVALPVGRLFLPKAVANPADD